MNVAYRVTEAFEKTNEIVNWSMKINTDKESPDGYLIDYRLRLMMKWRTFRKMSMYDLYRNYVNTFCEFTNEKVGCTASQYASCGFLPVGVEPECLCGQIVQPLLIPKLQSLGIEYFLVQPISPVWEGYKPMDNMALNHDVWVNKMEAAKLINKPVHNIMTLDLLEVLLS